MVVVTFDVDRIGQSTSTSTFVPQDPRVQIGSLVVMIDRHPMTQETFDTTEPAT